MRLFRRKPEKPAGPPLVVMAAGGTGGHMFPAQALAELMLGEGWRVKLATDVRGARFAGGFPEGTEIAEIDSAAFSRGGVRAILSAPVRIVRGIFSSALDFRRDRPSVVIGFGGYPSFPTLIAAGLLKLPRMIHEQNGVLGRVNRLFAARVGVVACGFWPIELPEGSAGKHVGNPVRSAIMARAGAPYIGPGDYPMSILVIGGSQGARVLSDVVPQALAALPAGLRRNLRVWQQAREEDLEQVAKSYGESGIPAEIATFFDDMPSRLAEAQLVIARSGASTVAELSAIGRPSILIPLPRGRRNEQAANARDLADAGAAILIPESELDSSVLAKRIRAILKNPDEADRMAAAALDRFRPEAAGDLAKIAKEVAESASRSEDGA